jgi:PD-(D/E)XK nuclease superfamily
MDAGKIEPQRTRRTQRNPVNKEEIGALVVDSAMKVQSALDPSLWESAYRACLTHELEMRRLGVRQEKPLPIRHEGTGISVGYQTHCQRTIKFSFASFASFAVQGWAVIHNTLPNL